MNSKNRFDQLNEHTLIGRASKGDLEAFNQLGLIYQNMTPNHAYALLGDSAQAD